MRRLFKRIGCQVKRIKIPFLFAWSMVKPCISRTNQLRDRTCVSIIALHATMQALHKIELFKKYSLQTMSRPAATPARSSSRRFGDDITAGSAGRSFATLAAPSSSTEQASEKRVRLAVAVFFADICTRNHFQGELDFASVPTVTTSIRRTAVSREAVAEELWEPALARADLLVLVSKHPLCSPRFFLSSKIKISPV